MPEAKLFDKIIAVVAQIPPGKVATYGQIATMVGIQNPRLVGFALAGLKNDTDVPWFRVINSKGKISLPEQGDDFKIQHSFLKNDGIIFDDNNTINFKQFRWNILENE